MKESLFFDRARLEIMSVLMMSSKPVSFNELLERTQLTKGNLSSHLRRLEEQKMVVVEKDFVDRKPRTTVKISSDGKTAFKNHLQDMQSLLKQISKA